MPQFESAVKFKIDKGAEIPFISDSTHKTIGSLPLEQPKQPQAFRREMVHGLLADREGVQSQGLRCQETPGTSPRIPCNRVEILVRIGTVATQEHAEVVVSRPLLRTQKATQRGLEPHPLSDKHPKTSCHLSDEVSQVRI